MSCKYRFGNHVRYIEVVNEDEIQPERAHGVSEKAKGYGWSPGKHLRGAQRKRSS